MIQPVLAAVENLRADLGGRITEVGGRMTTLEAKVDAQQSAIPHTYVSIREFSSAIADVRAEHANTRERVTAIEEWRLSETKAQASDLRTLQAQLQTQVTTTAVESVRDNAQTQSTATTHVIEINRATIGYLVSIVLMLLAAVLGHLWR